MVIYGMNPVIEALRARRIRALHVSDRGGPRLDEIVAEALRAAIPVERVPAHVLARRAGAHAHQGVVAEVLEAARIGIRDLLSLARGTALVVVLDGIEDPRN